jgi:serine/threonine-protein kinase
MLTGHVPFSGPNPLAVMNDRLVKEIPPPQDLNPEISPELQEVVYRALERDPRHRYATAQEMQWDLEHQEQVGVEDRGIRPTRRKGRSALFKLDRRVILYACLALLPLVIFGFMLVMARR